MLKIGEFSKLSLTTIKALRYYEEEGLLLPYYIDPITGYRFYETSQISEAAYIQGLRQLGFSIQEIKEAKQGKNMYKLLQEKKESLEKENKKLIYQLNTIQYLLEEHEMKYQPVLKKLPSCIVYYEERVLKDYSEITNLVLSSAEECLRLNPNLECSKPDYCFVEYLDKEYKKENILTRYSQAVVSYGKENERIHFKKLEEQTAICILHKGSYSKFPEAYSYILKFAKENGYEMDGYMREVYIDGVWNKESEDDYLTEIQMPVKTKDK